MVGLVAVGGCWGWGSGRCNSRRCLTAHLVYVGDNTGVAMRTGDRAIIIGAVAIIIYEKAVADDDDLISSRVAAYKQRHPLLTMAVVWVTAAHLLDVLPGSVDPYHQAVKYFRRHVRAPE